MCRKWVRVEMLKVEVGVAALGEGMEEEEEEEDSP